MSIPVMPWASRRNVLLGLVLSACLGLIVVLIALKCGMSQEALAQGISAINAHHSLPPEENAATIYDQLVASGVSAGTEPDLIPGGYTTLLQASRMESCWFPLAPGKQCYDEHGRRNLPMRRWMFTLTSAAQTDVVNGRCDAAAEKLDCLVRMAGHLQQQLIVSDVGVGMAIEQYVLRTLTECIMRADDAEELLRAAEAIPPDKLANNYEPFSRQVLQVSGLVNDSVRAEQTPWQRIGDWWREVRDPVRSAEENFDRIYLGLLWRRRGVCIMAGLRRYHDANGRWPDSLDEVRTLVLEQALTDPFTEQTFVYRKGGGGQFLLYSKGPNGRDDSGLRDGEADDYRVWP